MIRPLSAAGILAGAAALIVFIRLPERPAFAAVAVGAATVLVYAIVIKEVVIA